MRFMVGDKTLIYAILVNTINYNKEKKIHTHTRYATVSVRGKGGHTQLIDKTPHFFDSKKVSSYGRKNILHAKLYINLSFSVSYHASYFLVIVN